MAGQRLGIYVRSVSFPAYETGRLSHVNGITVNKTTQTVESAAAGAFHIEDVYPLIDGGRFPVKRIVGERVEAWTDEFATWRHGFELKQRAGADLTLDAIEGAGMLTKAQAGGPDAAAVILRQ